MTKRCDESFARGREDEARLRELYAATRRGGWTWQAVGAGVGLVGGGVAPVVGALLLAVAWACGGEAGGLSPHAAGGVLLLSTTPLLLAGAHCLDLLDERIGASRPVTRATSDAAARARAGGGVRGVRGRRAVRLT